MIRKWKKEKVNKTLKEVNLYNIYSQYNKNKRKYKDADSSDTLQKSVRNRNIFISGLIKLIHFHKHLTSYSPVSSTPLLLLFISKNPSLKK